MAETWTISVGDRVYGPYGLEQMRDFHTQNRLADHSLVARAGEEQFRPAGEDSLLQPLFRPAEPLEASAPRFGARADQDAGGKPGRFVIVAEMKSCSIAALGDEIAALGSAHRFGTAAWVLCSEASINTIRNALVQRLGKLDTLFIADAVHDRAAWFNFGPETDSRLRRMWSRPKLYHGVERRAVRRA